MHIKTLTRLAESDLLEILRLHVVEVLESRHLQVVPNWGQKLAELHVPQDLAQPLDASVVAHFAHRLATKAADSYALN